MRHLLHNFLMSARFNVSLIAQDSVQGPLKIPSTPLYAPWTYGLQKIYTGSFDTKFEGLQQPSSITVNIVAVSLKLFVK